MSCLLADLPELEYQRLAPYLRSVSLNQEQVLYTPAEQIREVYFPDRAMISLVSIMEDGSIAAVSLVGNEGMVGLPVFLGGDRTISYAIVQIAGSALRLNAEVLKREFQRGGELQRRLLLYTQACWTQVVQTAACNRQHTLQEQLAHWLLSIRDRIEKAELPLTQELIANMLGVQRPSISVAASILQQTGVIRYSRGRITILNQQGLEATACECYRLVQSEYLRLLSSMLT